MTLKFLEGRIITGMGRIDVKRGWVKGIIRQKQC
jgi:hypothetical protein